MTQGVHKIGLLFMCVCAFTHAVGGHYILELCVCKVCLWTSVFSRLVVILLAYAA